MEIKLSNILSVPAKVYETDAELEQEVMSFHGYDYSVVSKTPVHLRLTNLGNQKLRIEAEVTLELAIPCDRCLEDVVHRFEIQLNRSLNVSEDEGNQDLDDVNYIKECHLDVDMLVYEEVSVRFPMKNLCSEDCKGICPVCGGNRNVTECGCDDKVPDPRMADVLSIFDDYFKESSPPKQ